MIFTQIRNHVITWPGGKFFNQKPELVGEGFSTCLPNSNFRNRPVSSINFEHKKYIYKNCILSVHA